MPVNPSKSYSDKFSVRKTPKGKGVFARKKFRKNQTIGELIGKILVDAEYDSRHCIELSDTHVLEPVAPLRFLNHSCQPNCEIFSLEPDEAGDESHRVFLAALRTIQPEEELTIDYAWPADAAIPCLCRADNCRGWIVDLAELKRIPKQLSRKAAGLVRKRA
jgi:SET domain-containing protein